MLTREKNDLLYWPEQIRNPGQRCCGASWPVAASSQLEDKTPLAVDILLARNWSCSVTTDGKGGLLDRHCCHRGTDLAVRSVPNAGGTALPLSWLALRREWPLHGAAAEPHGGVHRENFRQAAYPVVERAGTFFAYLGSGAVPEFPNYDFLHLSSRARRRQSLP